MANVLHIPDLHSPFIHKHALKFVKKVYKDYGCDTVIFGGDVFDQYSWSRYPTDPNVLTGRQEFKRAKRQIASWVDVFPEVTITTGNHDLRFFKRLKESRIPEEMVVHNFNEIWGLPDTWNWVNQYKIDNVIYMHGARSGENAHVTNAKDNRCSTVSCHTHSTGGVEYMANRENQIFAMNTGCLVNDREVGFAYANDLTRRPVLGCGVILDGFPVFVPLRK
jgi:hypothetical protein